MAAAKVEIIYEAEASSLKAVVNEVNKTNSEIVSSAKQTATKFGDEFKNAAKSAAQAFGNGQIGGAVKSLTTQFNTLTTGLKLNTDAFKKFDVEVKKTNQIIVNSSQDVAKYEDRLRELSVAGQRATQEFQDIAKAVGQYKSAIIAADRAVDLYAKSTDAATGRIGELEDKLYDLALAGQTNTKEFKDLVREVANVKRAIIETDKQVDSFVERSRGFGTVVQNIELVGSAFQVVEGAAALFGDENKQLQETLVRLQAITAITSGIEQARLVLIDQTAQKTGIAAIAQKGYNLAVGTSTGVLKGFRLALAATGIGLLVIGVVALIQNFEKVKNVLSNAIPGFGEVAKGIGQVIDKTKEFLGIDDGGAKAKLALDNLIGSEKRKTDFQVAEIDRRINVLKAENKNTSDLEDEKEQLIIDSLKKQSKAVRDNQAQLVKLDDDTRKQIRENTIAVEADILDRENELEVKRIERATKAVQDRLNVELNGLKLSELLNGESLANQEAQLKKKAEIDKNNARLTIQNVKLRASAIKLIEAQLGLDIAKINLDAQNKIIENEVKLIEAKKVTGTATIEEEIKQAELSFGIEKSNLEAKIKLNQASNADLELLTANNENKIKQIRNRGIEENFNLRVQALELNKLLGATSLDDEIKLIRARAEAELKANENSTKSIEQKEADRKSIIVKTDAEITQAKVIEANKQIDIDNAQAEASVILGRSTSEQRIKLIQDEGQKSINLLDKKLLGEEAYSAEVIKINARTEAAIRAERTKTLDNVIELTNQTLQVLSAIVDFQKQASENRIASLERVRDTEIAAINESTDLESSKIRQREAAAFRAEQRISAEKTKQAKRDKALALFQAGIDLASSILKTGAQLGYPAAIPFQVAAGIIGGIQIAAIASRPIPKFKKGGIVGGQSHEAGGTMIEAEKGEFVVNRSSVARHRDALDAMNRSSAAFKKFVDERYVRPALIDFASKNKGSNVTVNASLNSKSMEREIKGLRKDLKGKSTVVNINSSDSRYLWQ
jgi:hypothetical protein